MAQQSKKARFHAQTKRENTLLRQELVKATRATGRATAIILGLLVQAGGEVVLAQRTTDTLNQHIARMGYKIEPDPDGLMKVVLVLQDDVAVANPEPPQQEAPVGQIVLTD